MRDRFSPLRARFLPTASTLARLVFGLLMLAAIGATPGTPRQARTADSEPGVGVQAAQPDDRARLREWIAAREWERVEDTLARALEQSPDDADLNYWRGLLLGPDDLTAAEGALQWALASAELRERAQAALDGLARQTDGRLAEQWAAFGVALVGVGEWPWAERAFDRALADDPLLAAALAYRGYAKDQQERDGLRDIENALALAPRDVTGYYFAGMHWRMAGDHARSERAFLDAYWLDPDNPALAAEVGGALELQGAYSDAATWYRMAVELAPDDPAWYALLARFYVESGYRPEEADFAFIKQAAERFPEHADLAVSYGWALYLQGDHARAYDVLNRAIGLSPRDVRARYTFGLVLEKLGDRDAAADSFWFVLDTAEPESLYSLGAARALQRLGFQPDAPS